MASQPTGDSFGICRLGFKCSWWHWRQAYYAVASERSIVSENHNYKSFSRVAMNTYIPIFRGLDARGGRKLRTDTQTHTRDNYSNPRCAHVCRRLITTAVLISRYPVGLAVLLESIASFVAYFCRCLKAKVHFNNISKLHFKADHGKNSF